MKNDPSTVNQAKSSQARIPISKHLEELRKRLIRVTIAAVIGTGVSFYFAKYIFDALESRAKGIDLIYIEMTEMMVTYFKVAIFGGIALAMPVIIYEIVKFIRPALKPKEKAYLYSLLPAVMLSFVAGVAFGFFILIPPAAHFLLTFGSNIATPQIRVENFVSLMLTLLFAIGIAFETPIVMFFLAKIGIVSAEGLMRHWRIAVIGAFVIGAAITPTFDPINQSLVSVPLIILYGVGIILAKFARRKKEAPVPVETSARA